MTRLRLVRFAEIAEWQRNSAAVNRELRLLTIDPGFRADGVLTMRISTPSQ